MTVGKADTMMAQGSLERTRAKFTHAHAPFEQDFPEGH